MSKDCVIGNNELERLKGAHRHLLAVAQRNDLTSRSTGESAKNRTWHLPSIGQKLAQHGGWVVRLQTSKIHIGRNESLRYNT